MKLSVDRGQASAQGSEQFDERVRVALELVDDVTRGHLEQLDVLDRGREELLRDAHEAAFPEDISGAIEMNDHLITVGRHIGELDQTVGHEYQVPSRLPRREDPVAG